MSNDDSIDMNKELNEIILERKQHIELNYPKIRNALRTAYHWPEFDYLRIEIGLAITFGLHQAALVLTNHCLESLMKYTLIYHHSQQQDIKETNVEGRAIDSMKEFTEDGADKYDDIDLKNSIDLVRKRGLITKQQHKQLQEYRIRFRNAYSHSSKKNTFGDLSIPVQALHIDQDGIKQDQSKITKIIDLLVVQGDAQKQIAERDALGYFLYMDSLTREIFKKLFPKAVEE